MSTFFSDPDFHAFGLERWYTNGTLLEVLCVGAGVIVTAINRIWYEGRDMHLPKYPSNENGLGPVGWALRAKILGRAGGWEEYEGWAVVCELSDGK